MDTATEAVVLVAFHGLLDPVIERRDAREHGGLLAGVAAKGRHEAGHTVDLPGAVRSGAVEGSSRVTVASGADVPASTHHGLLYGAAPPVPLGTALMVHDGQQGLLQLVWEWPTSNEPAPAADVAGSRVGQDVTGRREAGELDGVSQHGRARKLDEGDVIATGHTVGVPEGVHKEVLCIDRDDLFRALFLSPVVLSQHHLVGEGARDAVACSHDPFGVNEAATTGVVELSVLLILQRNLPGPAVGDRIFTIDHSGRGVVGRSATPRGWRGE